MRTRPPPCKSRSPPGKATTRRSLARRRIRARKTSPEDPEHGSPVCMVKRCSLPDRKTRTSFGLTVDLIARPSADERRPSDTEK
ncbi:Hypothetical protein NTJ_03748 [Nesidiocoris tenuis]|uniref:Uncharacterized protein n=1 Tax=Nesidiocoris tenuis TaxID=355587 RepID=A0ABN7AF84_9HEMI|nr:Hypothetical protein NTJ_03748 [Nesidiocoris tenuis]